MTCLNSYVPEGDRTVNDEHRARDRAFIAVRACFGDFFTQDTT